MLDIVRKEIMKDLPDTQAFAVIGSLFGGFDEGGGVTINVQSADAEAMRDAARQGYRAAAEEIPRRVGQSESVARLRPARIQDRAQRSRDQRSRLDARATSANSCRRSAKGAYVGRRYDGEKRLYMILKIDTARLRRRACRHAGRDARTPASCRWVSLSRCARRWRRAALYRLDRRRTIGTHLASRRKAWRCRTR